MPRVQDRAKVAVRLEDLGDELSVSEAAAIAGMHHNTIRKAMKAGLLAYRNPRAGITDPKRMGNQGYRISRRALHEFLFGPSSLEKP